MIERRGEGGTGTMSGAETVQETREGRPRRRVLRRLAQLGAVGLVAALLVLLVWKVAATDRGESLVAAIRAGEKPPAPAFSLPVIWDHRETWPAQLRGAAADGEVSLAELRGWPVVINFWASWCDPCKDEAPVLAAAAKAHAGEVVFLGLDVQDLTSDARRFLERHEANYVSVRDSGDGSYSAYGLTGVPETFYIDAQGRAVFHSLGGLSRRELEQGLGILKGAS